MGSVDLGQNSILSILGTLGTKRQEREKENQEQMLEMMKAGFQPAGGEAYAPTYGGEPAGDDLMGTILSKFREPDRVKPSTFEMAPWHRAEVHRKDREAAEAESERGRLHAAKENQKERAHNRAIARMNDTTRRVIASAENLFNYKSLEMTNEWKSAERALALQEFHWRQFNEHQKNLLKDRAITSENARFMLNHITGEVFVIQDKNDVTIVDTKGANAGRTRTMPKRDALISMQERMVQHLESQADLALKRHKAIDGGDTDELNKAFNNLAEAQLNLQISYTGATKAPAAISTVDRPSDGPTGSTAGDPTGTAGGGSSIFPGEVVQQYGGFPIEQYGGYGSDPATSATSDQEVEAEINAVVAGKEQAKGEDEWWTDPQLLPGASPPADNAPLPPAETDDFDLLDWTDPRGLPPAPTPDPNAPLTPTEIAKNKAIEEQKVRSATEERAQIFGYLGDAGRYRKTAGGSAPEPEPQTAIEALMGMGGEDLGGPPLFDEREAEASAPAAKIIGDVRISEDKYITKDSYGVSGDADTWDKGLTPDQVQTVRDEYAKINLVRLSKRQWREGKQTGTLPLEVKQAALGLGQLKSGDMTIFQFRENFRFLYEIVDNDKMTLEKIRQNLYPRVKSRDGVLYGSSVSESDDTRDDIELGGVSYGPPDVSGMPSTPNVLSRFLPQLQGMDRSKDRLTDREKRIIQQALKSNPKDFADTTLTEASPPLSGYGPEADEIFARRNIRSGTELGQYLFSDDPNE